MQLPREHGFWVMMPAALVSGMHQAGFELWAVLLSVALGITTVFIGGLLRATIRKADWAQLLASLSLALLLVPAELVAGLAPTVVAMHVAAWASLFVGCSLSVRACFARASRRRRYAPGLQFAALAVPILAVLGLAFGGEPSALIVALIGAMGVAGIAIWRPTPKRLKATGIVMALVVVVALLAQILSTGHSF